MKFTRIPKISQLIAQGVPVEVIPTYAALSDHTNNKTGLCWPRMSTLAVILGRSPRTIQRHLHHLQDLGLVEFVERRRWRGRFAGYTYRVLHVVALIRRKKRAPTTGHGQPVGNAPPIFTGTRSKKTAPISSPTGARSSSSRRRRGPETENTAESRAELRAEAAKRRVEGYEWLFEG
jgi:DNA-binding IclR family transcriptional regulator